MSKLKILFVVNIPLEEASVKGVFIRRQIAQIERIHYVETISMFGKSKIMSMLLVMKFLLLNSRRFDVVHAHQSIPILFASFFVPKRVAFIGSFLSCSHNNFRFSSVRLNKFLYGLATYRCNGVIVKNITSTKKSRCENTIVVPNSVDIKLFRPMESLELKREMNYLEKTKYIGFVCAGDVNRREKRFDVFCKVIKGLKNRSVEVEPLIISDKSPQEMTKFYNICSAIILTSDFEGSPNCVKEALACGVPVYSRDVGDVRYWLDGIQDCYLFKGDLEKDIDVISDKLQSRTVVASYIRQKYCDRALSEQETIEKIENLYEELL